jgi:hypothetical protein
MERVCDSVKPFIFLLLERHSKLDFKMSMLRMMEGVDSTLTYCKTFVNATVDPQCNNNLKKKKRCHNMKRPTTLLLKKLNDYVQL